MSSGAAEPGRGPLRAHLVPVLVSVAFLLVSPMGLLIVLFSGDSCCGENTTGTMAAVTAVIVAAACAVSWALAVAVTGEHRARRLTAFLIMAAPVSLVHVVFVTWVALTAF